MIEDRRVPGLDDRMSESAHRAIDESLLYYEAHADRIGRRLGELDREWSLERVVETKASILCLGGLALGTLQGNRRWLCLPAIGGGLLLIKALRGRAPASAVLRRLGFRPEREIEAERGECERLLLAANGAGGEWRATALERSRLPFFAVRPPSFAARPARTLTPPAPGLARARSAPAAAEERVRKPWYRKARYWVPAAILAALVIFRLLLTPVVEKVLRSQLQKVQGFSASFKDVSLSMKDLKLVVHGVAVDRIPPADAQEPLVQVDRIEIDIFGGQLLRGSMVAQARFIQPRFHLVLAGAAPETGAEPPPPAEPPDVATAMSQAVPFRFDRIEIRKGEMTLVDVGEPGRPAIHIGDIEATIENIQTGTQLGNRRPSIFAARAKIQGSGEMTAFYTANLLSSAMTFAGQAKLKGLKLAEINPLIAAKTGMKVEKGEFDVFASFSAVNGKITGGVKPMFKDVDVEAWDEDMITRLKAGLADLTLAVFSDRVPSRKAVAGIVPFSGEITQPEAKTFPAIMSVIRNAFVVGLASGFTHLPPKKEVLEGSLAAGSGSGAAEGGR